MSHLILHIGTHKTGTTTIQNSFWRSAIRLARHGVVYPRLAYQHSGHHGLIAEEVGLSDAFKLKGRGPYTLANLADRYADSDVDVFLSSEEFSRAEPNRSVNFDKLRECFRSFDRVTVLCFLRPQWRFLQSVYLEISQNRSPPRPSDLVQQALESGTCQGLYMDYTTLLSRLEQTFEPSEIVFVDFERARQKSGGILNAALEHTKSGLSHKNLSMVAGGHSNKSPAPLAQWMANLLAEPYAATQEIREIALSTLSHKTPTCCLTRAEVNALRDGFATSNADFLAKRRSFQPEFQLTDPPPATSCKFREDVTIEDWLRAGQFLARKSISRKAG